MKIIILVVLVFSLTLLCRADLYTLIEQGSQKCYLENLQQDTLVVATFHSQELNAPQNTNDDKVSLTITAIQTEDEKVVLTKETGLSGRFAFTTPTNGEFKICFDIKSPGWFGIARKWVQKPSFKKLIFLLRGHVPHKFCFLICSSPNYLLFLKHCETKEILCGRNNRNEGN